MEEIKRYKTCFVPNCLSTTIKTPEKLFFTVPQKEDIRRQWFQVAKRNDNNVLSMNSKFFCCQDHFNLKDDMDNYIRFCLMGAPSKLKNNVTPHKFDCQPNRVKTWISSSRPVVEKLSRKREISEILSNSENQIIDLNSEIGKVSKKRRNIEESRTGTVFATLTNCNNLPTQSINDSLQNSVPIETEAQQKILEPYDCNKIVDSNADYSTFSTVQHYSKMSREIGVQVQQMLVRPHIRSKSVMCKPDLIDASIQCDLHCSLTESPLTANKAKTQTSSSSGAISSIMLSCSTNPSSEYKLPSSLSKTTISAGCSDEAKDKNKIMKDTAVKITKYFISIESKKYVGITNDLMWIVDLLQSATGCSSDDILLTLMKIKMYDTFSILGDRFGLSTSQISKIFRKTVKHIAHYLKTLVYCPDLKMIVNNLPIAFRAHYSNVCIIVDAFEIEIEKPSNPVQQALTWSDYKKCNTLKYLIGCTPDGLVSFMSSGYGGRISDIVLFEDCKIMDIIPAKSGVMADRGFKQIQTTLNKKQCKLVRPPSVSSSSKSSKKDVLKTKSVASLRIHVERVIRRVREYKMLSPHACIDWNLIPYVDDIVVIVAGLINLQKPIIKK